MMKLRDMNNYVVIGIILLMLLASCGIMYGAHCFVMSKARTSIKQAVEDSFEIYKYDINH